MATQDESIRREPTMHTGGTFPRETTRSADLFLRIVTVVAVCVGIVWAVMMANAFSKERIEQTPEQLQQEWLRQEYERGQRTQSYLRGVIGAPPIHQQPKPERQP